MTLLIAGVDEAGRGPLVGSVFAAAVILPQDYDLPGLTDSKKLSEKNATAWQLRLKNKRWPGILPRLVWRKLPNSISCMPPCWL